MSSSNKDIEEFDGSLKYYSLDNTLNDNNEHISILNKVVF